MKRNLSTDFCDNSFPFDKKLMTDTNSTDPNKGITQKTYSTAVGVVCVEKKIDASHLGHIGRVLGACAAEMREDCPDHIRILGNWNPKTQETRYGTKLPMKILRSTAGFTEADGLHFNPRVSLLPPIELQKKIFPWLDEAYESFKKPII